MTTIRTPVEATTETEDQSFRGQRRHGESLAGRSLRSPGGCLRISFAMNGHVHSTRGLWGPILRETFRAWIERDAFTQSAALAFFALFSLAPVLVLLLLILALL